MYEPENPTKKSASFQIKDYQNNYLATSYGGINSGGLVNPVSGIGTYSDKSIYNFYRPVILSAAQQLETTYVQSPIAKRFIRLPVEQMFLKKREFDGLSYSQVNLYNKYFSKHQIYQKLIDAMCAARLTGSAFFIFITKDELPEVPLSVDTLQKGDLENVQVYDRFNVFPVEQLLTLRKPSYFDVDFYRVIPRNIPSFIVHKSRLIRFDGIKPMTTDSWTAGYDIKYGVSELIPVLDAIHQEAQSASSISQLLAEMSIPVLKTEDFRRANGANCGSDSPSMAERAEYINTFKSTYNTLFLDSTDEFSREEASLTGVADVLDFFSYRLAAACGIPAPILLGRSPLGMNATGDADLKSNALNVATKQENELRPVLDQIDEILNKTSGLNTVFTYDFPSILTQSEEEKVAVANGKADITTKLTQTDVVTTPEARKILNGDPVIGELGDLPDGFKSDLDNLLAQKQKEKAQAFMTAPRPEQEQATKIQTLRDKISKFFTSSKAD
jgi:phage-related protein (TIGR01555 family)